MIMRLKTAWLMGAILSAGLSASVCFAQGSAKTKTSLGSEVNGQFSDQMSGFITPMILRNVINDIVSSFQQFSAVNAQVGTNYTIQSSDYGQLITVTNANPVAVTIPSTSAPSTFYPFNTYVSNLGAGTVTITPVAGTINGLSSFSLTQNQSAWIVSDGNAWQVFRGFGVGTTPTAPAYTFNGNPTGSIAQVQNFTVGSLPNKASPSGSDLVMLTDQSASGATKQSTVSELVGSVSAGVGSLNGQTGNLVFYQTPQVRLTLTQGTPVTTSDVAAATSLYLEPYNGSQLSIYDGFNWNPLPVASSTYSLPATQTQTCTLAGTITVIGCTDTSQMVIGQQVTGTNIPASDTIATIVSSTSFTLANAATGSGSTSLTFKLPPSTAYDVYAINNSGVPKLVWSAAWSGTTPPTRLLQNGVYVLSSATTQRLLGSVYTSTIAGQLVDSKLCRCLSNLYNQVPRNLLLQEATSTWTYSTAAWAQVNNGTADQVAVMFTVPGFVDVEINVLWGSTVTGNAWVGVGVDSATVPSSSTSVGGSAGSTTIIADIAKYVNSPGIGYHYFAWLEYGIGSGTQTWYGTGGAADRIQSGMSGMVAN